MGILDELLVELGYDYDPEALKSFQSDLDKTISLAKKLVLAISAGAATMFGFTAATTSASDSQGKLANQIGISVSSLDELQFANKRAGGSAEGLSGSLEQLSIRIGETARGVGSGIEAFGILGLSVTDAEGKLKSADKVLLEVSDSFESLNTSQQIELADKLGLRESIKLLQEGRASIESLTAEARALGVTTAEDAALSANFQDSLTDLWQIIRQVSRVITRTLAPILENVAHSVTAWWTANQDIIQQRIPEYIDKITFAFKLLTLATISFIGLRLATTIASLITLMKGLTLRVALFNAAVAAIPALIFSLITAIALLAEDAKVFFEGGESFIGRMIEKYPKWAKELRTVAAVFATVADLTTMIFDGWGLIFDLFTNGTLGEDLKLVFKQIQRDLGEFIDSLKTGVSDFAESVKQDISSFIDGLIADVSNFFSSIKDGITSTLDIGNIKDTVFNFFSGKDEEQSSDITNINENSIDIPPDNIILENGGIQIEKPFVEYMPEQVIVDKPEVEYMPSSSDENIFNTIENDNTSNQNIENHSREGDNTSQDNSRVINTSSVISHLANISNQNIENHSREGDNTSSVFNNFSNETKPNSTINRISIPDIMENPRNDTQSIVVNLAQQGRSIAEGSPEANNVVPNHPGLSQNDISRTSNTTDNSVVFEGGIEITVDGSSNPEETANAIRRELDDLVEQTSINSNSAVRI